MCWFVSRMEHGVNKKKTTKVFSHFQIFNCPLFLVVSPCHFNHIEVKIVHLISFRSLLLSIQLKAPPNVLCTKAEIAH